MATLNGSSALTKEHTITTIRALLESDARYASLSRQLGANPDDGDTARKLFIATQRVGKEFVVYLGGSRHLIQEWFDDGIVTGAGGEYKRFSGWSYPRRHNHASWDELRSNAKFRWEIE